VAEDHKSVTRQVEEARAFAARHGWTVLAEHIYVDDGISGAEFATRPGFILLMSALKPRAPFQVLVMSEESRLGREQIEVGYALKQLITSEVRVYCYLTGAERTLDTALDKAMLALQTMGDEMEREKARQRTFDAMQRKARAGHVTGGRCFGYENVEVRDADGHRLRVEQRINGTEATVVRRIFALTAEGYGVTRIAKVLNGEGAPSPRAQQGRPNGWCASSVREVLRRSRYRGIVEWGKTKKRDKWGQKKRQHQPLAARIAVQANHLRIVSDDEWNAAHAQMEANFRRYSKATGRRGRPPGSGAKYLLAGLLRCAECNGGIEARSRKQGAKRVFFYGCSSFQRKGSHICSNGLTAPMQATDVAVLDALKDQLLAPAIIEEAVSRALVELTAPRGNESSSVEQRLDKLKAEAAKLAEAVAVGGNIPALLDALKAKETERQRLEERLAALQTPADSRDIEGIRESLLHAAREWHRTLTRHPAQARTMVQTLLDGRLLMRPKQDEDGVYYEFSGVGTLLPIVSGIVPHNLASPTGTVERWRPAFDGISELRAA
jgi:DNA invertase Pin-like site-specific DNA recombinase